MSSIDKATQTQLSNIQTKTGKSLDELTALVQTSGLTRHSEIRKMLIDQLGLGYGDANTLAHFALKSDGASAAEARGLTSNDVVDEIYSGPKAGLRPIHDRVMEIIHGFGEFEVAPKKGYLSLRRKKQFVMVGPATNSRVEIGLNIKGLPAADRLLEQPSGSMCNYKIKVTDAAQVDAEVIAWMRQAYEAAG